MNSQNFKKQSSSGLSLIEILIALAITTILFTLVARSMSSGGKGLATIISNSDLLEDTRYAGELIYGDLQNSVYVYPPQTKLQLNARSDYHTENPDTRNNKWVIGNDNIIAMIVAPKSGITTCPTDPNACLTFVAYYAVKRDQVTSNRGFSYEGGSLPADLANPDALMLFEYRKTLDTNALSSGITPPVDYTITSPAGSLKDVTARLVADYINPTDGFGFVVPTAPETYKCSTEGNRTACPMAGETALALSHNNTMLSGSFKLSGLYTKGKKNYTTPELEFSFNPRNLY